jgi:uncharacterized membrane protein
MFRYRSFAARNSLCRSWIFVKQGHCRGMNVPSGAVDYRGQAQPHEEAKRE